MGEPKSENRIIITDRAIGTDQDKKFVFVVDGENKVNYRQIKPGSATDGLRIVESGLAAGEKIVVNGLQRIRPGAIVAPQVEDKVAASQ
jgi:multidrug efflux system membrane fusion protein